MLSDAIFVDTVYIGWLKNQFIGHCESKKSH